MSETDQAATLARRLREAGAITGVHVVCLCAEWCTTCREYREVFEGAAQDHASMRFDWVDIEADADLVGDIEVETFPTVLIAGREGVLFFGPLLPHADHIARLLRAYAEGPP